MRETSRQGNFWRVFCHEVTLFLLERVSPCCWRTFTYLALGTILYPQLHGSRPGSRYTHAYIYISYKHTHINIYIYINCNIPISDAPKKMHKMMKIVWKIPDFPERIKSQSKSTFRKSQIVKNGGLNVKNLETGKIYSQVWMWKTQIFEYKKKTKNKQEKENQVRWSKVQPLRNYFLRKYITAPGIYWEILFYSKIIMESKIIYLIKTKNKKLQTLNIINKIYL